MPFEIHRLKGRLVLKEGGVKVIQGVRELFEIFDPPAEAGGPSNTQGLSGKIVLVGRQLEGFDFPSSLKASLASGQ